MVTAVNPDQEALIAQIKILADYVKVNNINRLLLEKGQFFEYGVQCKLGTVKQCFKNATILAECNPTQLIYCEGMALGVIPVWHAWCIDHRGIVHDPTWRKGKVGPDNRVYFGIPLKLHYVQDTILRTERYGVIDNWEDDWPILTDDPKLWLEDLKSGGGQEIR
jgi:hypothetical protein